jgi:hypothetical protein
MDRAAVVIGILALAGASAALAGERWDEGVVVSAHGKLHGASLGDRAVYACARSMLRELLPGYQRIRVFTASDAQVFGDIDDDVPPGYEMSVLLKVTDVGTGETLGTAEYEVTLAAKVVSLQPE